MTTYITYTNGKALPRAPHRWHYLHLWRGLRNQAWDDDSRATYAEWAAEERRELLACLKERREKRGRG